MSRRVLRFILLSLCAVALLTAQSRPVGYGADLPPGYRPLSDTSAAIGALAGTVTLDVNQRTLGSIITEIARQAGVSFATDASQPGMEALRDMKVANIPAREAIQRLLQGTAFRALVGPTGQIVIARRPSGTGRGAAEGLQGKHVRLSGYVRSAASHELIRRAQLTVDGSAIRVESNDDGFFAILLPVGAHRLRIRSIGYAPFDTTVTLTANVTRDLLLQTRKVTLAAITVQADAKGDRPDLDPRTPDMSVVRLDLAAVKLLPTVLGEPDPIRSLTLLPGVSLSSDASTAFSVRGGNADQNLFLLDEATVYNPSHILGFLSTFNADAVDNVTLYKGAIPSKFGGRLSSVVDVRQREGNANEFAGSASIGLLSGRGIVEGPLPRRVGSYMLAARRSWADLFTGLASDTGIKNTTAYFYDVNAKTNVRLGSSGALLLSGYLGRDRFAGKNAGGASWGNRAVTLRWNQAVGGRLFSKVTTAWGDYDYNLRVDAGTRDTISWTSRVASVNVKIDETYYVSPSNTIEFGAELTDQRIRPGSLTPIGKDNPYQARRIQQRNTLMPAAWIGQELQFGERFSVRYGVRYAGYERRGPGTIYQYLNNAPVVYSPTLGRYEPGVVRDSSTFAGGRRISSASGLEPRISGRMMLGTESSIKASYARTQQFLLLVSNTNSISPLDIWEPAGPWSRPQVADQYALGYSANRGGYEVSVEGYYKHARNVVDFIDGADLLLNPRVETQMVQGVGRAFGLEVLARRTRGHTTGWISYTVGRSEQRFTVPDNGGVSIGGGINGGRWYPSPFDKTHNLSVVMLRPLGAKWTAGATFSLATGLPATFPNARYVIDGLLVTEYGPRNGGRLPRYHRLDLSLTRKFGRGELQFGVLNAYNRFNAQSLRFRQRTNNPSVTEAVQTSIFGIVPSIAYAFHF